MRILIVGRKSMYNAEYFYQKAFRDNGNDVLFIDSYTDVNHQLVNRQIHTRTEKFNVLLKHYWINKNLLRIVDGYDPNIVIVFKGEFILNSTIEQISQNRNIYLFYPDTYKFKPLLENRLQYFKKVFTAANRTDFYYNLGAKDVVTIPWACDPEFHKKLNVKKSMDVSFIGTAYPERRRIIRQIKDVDLFGDFWYGFRNAHKSVHGEDFIETINRSSINLNLQAKISVDADAPTMRTFELAGCGAFQISDYMESMKKYFPMLPTFKTITELKELINYYKNNTDDRNTIGEKSMALCYKFFKYTDAARMIISKL